MTTVAVPSAAPRTRHSRAGAYDRVFYGGMAAALALTVFIGFAPTYYLNIAGDASLQTITGAPVTTVVHVHAVLFTAWVLLFIVQTALVSTRRVAVHRRLGVAGVALAAAMIVVGTTAAIAMARRGGAPPGVPPLTFLAIPLGDMVMFAGLITAAVVLRRKKEAHKRLMLLAYASLMAAPAARLPGMLALGPLAFYGIALLFPVAGAIYDFASRGHVHRAYVWGGSLLLMSVPLRLLISSTSSWNAFAQMLTR
jgi:hypothetical protein